MSFLPIVQRELRAAARRKSTFRLRWWTTLVALTVAAFALVGFWVSRSRASYGNPVFDLLTGYAFGLSLLAGVLLTADCLSAEKRQGTLGLLFLSNLKGYDVVLGKFIAASLNAFYALLALLPVTGLPLMLGGVAGEEFWRMALALLNALFFSLALGFGASTFARDSQRAQGATLLLLLLLAGAVPALAAAGLPARFSPALRGLTWVSPFYPYWHAADVRYAGHAGIYWGTLVASHLFGWACLAVASLVLPWIWQDETVGVERRSVRMLGPRQIRRRRPARPHRAPPRLLALNPILWLIGNQTGLRLVVWCIVLGWGVVLWVGGQESPSSASWAYIPARVCAFCLKLLLAHEAARFFADARRTGELELILCTPLRSSEILQGQTLALKRVFLYPMLVFLCLNFVPVGFQAYGALSTGWVGALPGVLGELLLALAASGWLALGLIADSFAVIWFGRWLALTSRRPHLAPGLTILFVLVIPSAGICGLDLLADLIFITHGMSAVGGDFRWRFAQQNQAGFRLAPLPAPISPAAAPPVIAH